HCRKLGTISQRREHASEFHALAYVHDAIGAVFKSQLQAVPFEGSRFDNVLQHGVTPVGQSCLAAPAAAPVPNRPSIRPDARLPIRARGSLPGATVSLPATRPD